MVCLSSSLECMHEFMMACHHNLVTKGKKNRLIILMMLDNPNDVFANNENDTVILCHYLRQYRYIDCKAGDWQDKLFYALPVCPLLQHGAGDIELLDTFDDD